MIPERFLGIPARPTLENGDIISPQRFTDLILQQKDVEELALLTMVYDFPKGGFGASRKIHEHLLQLADQGTQIHVGVDYTYSHLFAPHSDVPMAIAPFVLNRQTLATDLKRKRRMFEELEKHPRVDLVYHGREHPKPLPFSNIDHRKILRVKGSNTRDFAVIYGFNINESIDHEIDSGVYMTDPDALAWVDAQIPKPQKSASERTSVEHFTFVTREVTKNGNKIADEEMSEVIEGAENSLLFCSQFIPDGPLFKQFQNAADRGVDVTMISNGPSPSRQPMYMVVRYNAERRIARARRKSDNIHLYVPKEQGVFIHTKALITDVENPELARAIIGTDNMSNQLSRYFGQREILVELRNYDHIQNLYNYLRENVFPHIKESDL